MCLSGATDAYVSSNGRDDYKADDVEAYFNYMGMLASEVSGRGYAGTSFSQAWSDT